MEVFEVPITIYKTQNIKVNANSLEEAKNNIKKHMHSQRQLFTFDDIEDAIIIERKEIEHAIPKMCLLWDRIIRGRD